LIEVRNVADLGMYQSPAAGTGGRSADFERAEFAREIAQLRVVEVLVVEHQHGVAVDRLPDRFDRHAIDWLAEIDAADLGGEERMNLPYRDGHATSSFVIAGEDLLTR